MSDFTMDTVQDDMVVLMDYTLTVEGQEIDKGPIEYLQGHGNIIPGLETALNGMKIGETREVFVSAVDAYGEYDEESLVQISRESFPPDFEISLGIPMRIRDEEGHVFSGTVTALSEDSVEFDMNHPLQGKIFILKLPSLSCGQLHLKSSNMAMSKAVVLVVGPMAVEMAAANLIGTL